MNHAEFVALTRALRVLGDHGENLDGDADDAQLNELRTDLKRAMAKLDEAIGNPQQTTRCREHPTGPVDEDASDLCLLCEARRRGGRAQDTQRRARGEDGTKIVRVRSRFGLREHDPKPHERWIPELWDGTFWQLCGTPRTDRSEAELYVNAQLRRPRAAPAYRVVDRKSVV